MSLQLQKILPSRRTKNRVWLIFSDSSKFPFFIDDVVIFNLKTGKIIDDDLFSKIKESSLFYLLYNYSLNQVALSPKIARVLSPKIKQKLYFYQKKYHLDGDFSFLIDQIIDKLSEKKLLNEDSYIAYLLHKNKGRSRQYLSQLFNYYHLQFPSDFVSRDQDILKNLLLKKNVLSLNLSETAVKNKLFSSLMRKGFAYSDIKSVIDELTNNG